MRRTLLVLLVLTISATAAGYFGSRALNTNEFEMADSRTPPNLNLSPPPGCVTAPPGMVSWWPGENSGNDIKGANNGTLQSGATFAAGEVGQAFNFSGDGDFVQVASPAGLPLGNSARTMMMWFKTPNSWGDTYQVLIQYGGNTPGSKFGIYIPDYWNRSLSFWGENSDFAGSTPLQLNTWYHGAVTYDGSTARLYLNGQPETSQAKSLNTALNSGGFTIGRTSNVDNITSQWNGLVDEAMIFDRALSPTEIQSIYNAGNAGVCTSSPTPTPTPTPAGKIVFDSGRDGNYEIYVMNADGSSQTRITNNPGIDTIPAWSYDGTKIAFASKRDGSYEIYSMDANGTNEKRLTNNGFDDVGPKWSPDGTKIAFFRWTTKYEIYAIDANGSNETALTDSASGNYQPAWSPDGTKIVFVSFRDGNAELYTMDPNGANPTRLTTNSAIDETPAWSPDGTKIAFTSRRDGNQEIYVMNANGSNQTRLTNMSANDRSPVWSPDGSKIAFTTDRDGNTEIYAMDANGANQVNLSNNWASDEDPDWKVAAATPTPTPTPSPTPTPTPSTFVQLSSANYNVQEDCTAVTITVNRIMNTSLAASVDYATSNATATDRGDYIIALGTLHFAPGETSKTFDILINEDSYSEGPETFNVTLTNPSNVNLGDPAVSAVTITDDTGEPYGNVIDDPHNFVCQHYHDFLNRQPDTAGWDFWTNEITSCGSNAQCIEEKRISVSASFFLSIEFQQTGYLVERMYKATYGDASGTSTWNGTHQLAVPTVRFKQFLLDTQRITDGVVVLQPGWEQKLESNKQAFANDFVHRPDFYYMFPTSLTPTQFVDQMNQNAGSVLSAPERDNAIALFGSANNISDASACAQALRQVAEDPDLAAAESNRAFVLMQYIGYLRRNPDDPQDTDYTGYDFWLIKLNQFNGNYINAEMVKAFITSIEYRQRFAAN